MMRPGERGAALLLAMMIVALVATLAAGMVWQQFRAIQVEVAERARAQSAWMLTGALDWSRLILREDGRADTSGRDQRPPTDHLGEPWATPLAEARLSTFLAADRDNTSEGGPEAFLSGSMTDAQARYNLRNLVTDDGKLLAKEVATLTRLCDGAGVTGDTVKRLAQGLAAAWAAHGGAAGAEAAASAGGAASAPTLSTLTALPAEEAQVAPVQFSQLAWLGLDAKTLEALRPLVDILPQRTPVNLNPASREVLAAVLDVDLGTAERVVQARQRSAFTTIEAAKPHLPEGIVLDPARVAVRTSFFHVVGELRLDARVLRETSLVQRRGSGAGTEVVSIYRVRTSRHLGVQP
jgi:general secretion pathway protein K